MFYATGLLTFQREPIERSTETIMDLLTLREQERKHTPVLLRIASVDVELNAAFCFRRREIEPHAAKA